MEGTPTFQNFYSQDLDVVEMPRVGRNPDAIPRINLQPGLPRLNHLQDLFRRKIPIKATMPPIPGAGDHQLVNELRGVKAILTSFTIVIPRVPLLLRVVAQHERHHDLGTM